MPSENAVNLIVGESTLLQETHLPAAFPEVGRGFRAEAFLANLLNQLGPVKVGIVETFGNEPVIDPPLAQLCADLLRTVPALVA